MKHHKHRFILTLVKIATFVAWWKGVPDPIIAAIVTPMAVWWAARIIRDGLRENYLADLKDIYRWMWEDLVWSHTQWSNGSETPEEGIARLTRHLVPEPAPVAATEPTAQAPAQTKRSALYAWVRGVTATPSPVVGFDPPTTGRAPHELALR